MKETENWVHNLENNERQIQEEARLENVTTRITEIAPGEFVALGKAGLVVGDEVVDISLVFR